TWQTRAIRTSEIKKAKAAFYMKGKQKTRKNSDLSKTSVSYNLNICHNFSMRHGASGKRVQMIVAQSYVPHCIAVAG
ncbi:MAG: hypothetical protein KIG22_07135, partial [Oxalobacter sp.]|nr:hypothetical protein [Oxalobacter sp.]